LVLFVVIKKTIYYIIIFVFSLIAFLLATMPANYLWKNVLAPNVNLKSIGLTVDAVDGSVWDGQALLQYKGLSSIVDWDVSVLGMLTLALPVEVIIKSQAGEMLLNARLSPFKSTVVITKADVALAELSPSLRRYKVKLDGDLMIKDLKVSLDGELLESASGLMSWSGGNIAYPAGRKVHERDMPTFQAKLTTKDSGVIHLGVRDENAKFDVIDATLSPEGVALLKVSRRLLDLADEPWPQNSKEQDTVFKVKKMIY
jgi:general secretion pathway protein N